MNPCLRVSHFVVIIELVIVNWGPSVSHDGIVIHFYGSRHIGSVLKDSVTIVTNEQPRPQSQNRILLPDVCTQFNVIYKDTFEMLTELAVRYDFRGSA